MNRKLILPSLMLALLACLVVPVTAEAGNVLMVNISGGYNGDAANIHQTLISAGATTTYVNLTADGQAADALGAGSFDQIWVFDLSTGADNYPTDYSAIADWYNNRPSNEVICDSRMLSSYWAGRWPTEGTALTANYYQNIDNRGGGLVLGTDHAPYQGGINEINALIGLELFEGTFNLATIPVDTANPLMNTPNDMGPTLSDDSSPGQTPYGIQPNGDILYTVAWHSNNHDTPGISSTIEGEIGMHVTITTPADGSEFELTEAINLAAEITGGEGPFSYEWSFDDGTPLGEGQSLEVPAGTFPVGSSMITVVAMDSADRIDDDSIEIIISAENLPPMCDAGGPYHGNAGEAVEFNGGNSVDPDGEIVTWTWNFGDGNTGTGIVTSHTYAEDGIYEVTLCVTDNEGLTSCCATEQPTVPTDTTKWGALKASYR